MWILFGIFSEMINKFFPFKDFTSSVCCPLHGLPARRRVSLVVELPPDEYENIKIRSYLSPPWKCANGGFCGGGAALENRLCRST